MERTMGTEIHKVRLGDIFSLQMGKTPARANPNYWGGTNKWISIADIGRAGEYISNTKEFITDAAVKESGIKSIPPGTLIMSFKLSIGKTSITAEEMFSNEAIMAFLPNDGFHIDLHYLYHQFSCKDWSSGMNLAVIGQTLNKKSLQEHSIILPPLAEQKRIAEELDNICAAKKDAEAIVEKLKLLAKSLFVEMFGDPVANEKNWNTAGLLELGECKNGMNFSPNDKGYNLHCIGVGDFKDNIEISDTSVVPTISVNARPSDELILRDGDILFVRSNGNKALVGRSLLVSPGNVETTFSGFCIRYRINSEKFLPKFAIHFLRHESVRRALQGRGANIQNLNQKMIQSVSAILPPLELQRKFAAFIEQLDKSQFEAQALIGKLDLLYRAKLQEYFG